MNHLSQGSILRKSGLSAAYARLYSFYPCAQIIKQTHELLFTIFSTFHVVCIKKGVHGYPINFSRLRSL